MVRNFLSSKKFLKYTETLENFLIGHFFNNTSSQFIFDKNSEIFSNASSLFEHKLSLP